ncbi:putative F-box/LRR-repeat protein At4g15060 [Humulus lupulus]|uniref:putative F-box/LRR-repeat protein At4g15060 n=1 Tax=Humulus lupulus TaxID=3486 RepID=UPI002B41207F|nr:putative F-box/LRR-repeat protein At4g15060 [Humulus lupulus]
MAEPERGVTKKSDPPEKKRVKMTSITEAKDRISKLPDTVIVHILSFRLTEDVVRTCLLSKRWKFMWYSVPKLFFSDSSDTGPDSQKFYNYIDNCLEHRKKGMYFIVDSAIASFKLQMYYCYRRSKARRLDKWLDFAVENKVKELSLRLWPEKDNVKNDVLSKSLLDCPSLEKLLLTSCHDLSIDNPLQLRSSSLKFMQILFSISLQVEAVNLESLLLRDNPVCFEKIKFSACKAIRNLKLEFCRWSMPDHSSFADLISNFPLLENLTLENCYGMSRLGHLKISGQHLKCFNFKNSFDEDNVIKAITIKSAPKLASFHYDGNMDCSISVESSNLLNGKFVLRKDYSKHDTDLFIQMVNFLMNLNCSWNMVTLHVWSGQILIMPEGLKRICRSPSLDWKHLRVVLPDWKHLRFISDWESERESDFKDTLMWIAPSLQTLSIHGKQIF